jgi:hypothetical protein
MRLTRARLAAGAAALACLVGPAAALAEQREDDQTDPGQDRAEQPEGDRDAGRRPDSDGQEGGGQDGGAPAPPEAFVQPPPPELEGPEPRPEPRERRRRQRPERHQPRGRAEAPRRAAPAPPIEPETGAEATPPEAGEPAAPGDVEEAPADEPERRRARDPRCDRDLERGEELLSLDDLCAGETGDGESQDAARRSASATGTVRNALLGALGLLGAVGFQVLALRSRDPR